MYPLRRRFYQCLAACLLSLLAANSALAGPFDTGLLWRVEGRGAAPSYLFGTIHSENPEVLDLPRPVATAFDEADSVTLEVIPDTSAMASAGAAMVMTGEQDLADVLGESLYRRAAELLVEYGLPEAFARRLQPWAVMVVLSTPKPKTGRFLDVQLYQRALQNNKSVHGLETVEEQLQALQGIPREDQVALVRETVENHGTVDDMLTALHEAYLERDLAAMQRISQRHMAEIDPRVVRLLTNRLIDERNRRMVRRMKERLAEGSAFIAVGALHLPGEDGLLQSLVDRGYEVRRIY